MKFDLDEVIKEAKVDQEFWQDQSETLLSQDEIAQRMQKSAQQEEQDNDQ